jgi:hypothetical protein
VKYTIKHAFNISADDFWKKLFFDPEYNRALFEGHLGFSLFKVLTLDTMPDGTVHRKTECAPKVELPAAAKKIFGDNASYIEDGRFDPKTQRFTVDVLPKVGGDKIKTRVVMWVEKKGDKQVDRIVEVDNSVKVFGIGGMLESFIEKQTRANYDAAATFTQRWIQEKGL